MGCKGNLPNVNGTIKKIKLFSEHSTYQQNKEGIKKSYLDKQE